MKSKFGYYIDNAFCELIIFMVVFVWTRHYIHNIPLLIITTFFITFAVSFLVMMIFDKKRQKSISSQQEQNETDKLINSLIFMTNSQIIEYISGCLSEYDITKKKDYIRIEYKGTGYILVPRIYIRNINCQDYVNIYKMYKNFSENIVVLSLREDSDCIELRKKLNKKIIFLSLTAFYKKFINKPVEISPPFKVSQKKGKKITGIMNIILSRRLSKKYFILTIIFCIYAFLFRYSLYYAFFSLLLGLLTIISLKNKKFNNTDEELFV